VKLTNCLLCNEININNSVFPKHLFLIHGITPQEYYNQFLKKDNEGFCKVCSLPTKFYTITLGYAMTCSSACKTQVQRVPLTEDKKITKKSVYLLNLGVKIENLSVEEQGRLYSNLVSFESKYKNIKRLKTNEQKYGKGSCFGSKESIYKQRTSTLINKGYDINLLQQCSDEELKTLYGEEVSKRITSKENKIKRIAKEFNVDIKEAEKYSDNEISRLWKECYVHSLIQKGRNVVIKYDLGEEKTFSEKELLILSGYEKQKNAKNRTQETKENDNKTWKITHLKNYYNNNYNYDSLSKLEIDNLYRIYLYDSGRLEKIMEKGRGGKWSKGWVDLKRLDYKIFYRSSYELDFLLLCENNSQVRSIQYNLPGINYIFENEDHWYFPDFIINNKYMVEIKANYQLKENKTIAKIDAGKVFCKNNNLNFVVITETELYNQENSICVVFQ